MADMKERFYALKFAAILCVVCCTLITGASVGLQGLQRENMEVDRQKNILKAAGILGPDENVSYQKIKALFHEKIEEVAVNDEGEVLIHIASDASDSADSTINSSGHMLPLYLYKDEAQNTDNHGKDGIQTDEKTQIGGIGKRAIKAYVIPIESRGLWGKIRGYLAFENDGMTVAGFTVYSHSETPGLGGEIEKAWFGKNFIGKKVVNAAGEFVSVSIAKGAAENLSEDRQASYVDGISGATLTGKYLSEGLRENLERYENVSVKFRQTQSKEPM